MTETVEASVAHEFHASPEQVFDAWLNTDYVERWMSAALKSMEVEIDRPRKLVFTWFTSEEDEMENSSIVALTI